MPRTPPHPSDPPHGFDLTRSLARTNPAWIAPIPTLADHFAKLLRLLTGRR